MYPKVTREYFEHLQRYGNTAVLGTQAFFYGLRPQEELSVEIDPGKTLLVTLQTVGADLQDGVVKVQFELNGQSRTLRTEKAQSETSVMRLTRRRADPNDATHVAAPMPGSIIAVSAKPGQRVKAGSPLVLMEAMKMETSVAADRDCEIAEILVSLGDQVLARDLMIVLRS